MGKAAPKLLFIPTASSDARGYIELIEQYFVEGDCPFGAYRLEYKDGKMVKEEI